jgi:hypothetical protein
MSDYDEDFEDYDEDFEVMIPWSRWDSSNESSTALLRQ